MTLHATDVQQNLKVLETGIKQNRKNHKSKNKLTK